MARPRADAQGPGAVERIEAAFLDMISRMPYAEIKVLALAREANVSPNTLYYHFRDVEDVAASALAGCLDGSVVRAVVAGGEAPDVDAARLAHVAAYARSRSAELTGMLTRSLRSLWLEGAGVSEGDLDDMQDCELTFIFAGAVALLAASGGEEDPGAMAGFLSRPLGAGIAETMEGLAGSGGGPSL